MTPKAANPRSRSSGSDPYTAAWERAVRLLAARDCTEHDIRTRLDAAGMPPDAIDAAIERLGRAGYLDDTAVAVRLAERRLRRGYGSERVHADLTARGVPEAALAAALATAQADEVARARAVLACRRLGTADQAQRGRAARFLLGRGFPEDVVLAILGEGE